MSYRRPIPATWWLKRRPYTMFMIRELSSLAVGGYSFFLLYLAWKLGQGPEPYAAAIGVLTSPVSIVLHLVGLALALYHTTSWFNVTPKIIIVRLGDEPLPEPVIAGAHYAAWIAASAVVAWIILGI